MMNRASGFIVLHRKLLDWEWHNDPNTLSLFIHILLGANHEDNVRKGVEIKRGQLMTSLTSLAKETGQTEKQVRVSLDHLKRAGCVADYSTNRYRMITVVKYDDYQDKGRQKGRQKAGQKADKGQATGHQYNNITNINNITNKQGIGGMPPSLDDVKAYIQEIGSQIDPERFYDHYSSCGWVLKGGQKMKDWKATIRNWDRRERNGEQRQPAGNDSSACKGIPGADKDDYERLKAGILYL